MFCIILQLISALQAAEHIIDRMRMGSLLRGNVSVSDGMKKNAEWNTCMEFRGPLWLVKAGIAECRLKRGKVRPISDIDTWGVDFALLE